MVLDGLDGRVARMTRTQSEFGAEYDSLSDMVSFGAAPALVMYEWALKDLGRAGWIAAFVYCACAALRLARFNTNIDVIDKRWYQERWQIQRGISAPLLREKRCKLVKFVIGIMPA